MDNSIARFQISADEDFHIQFVFVGLSLAGRTLRILVKERASNVIRTTLTLGAGLTLDGTDTVTALVPQATASAWAKGEFETDLHDITGGANTRLVGARTLYDLPGRLPHGVIGAKATVQWVVNKAIVTAIGGIGPTGPANTLTPGDVTTLPPGQPAAVRITGTAPDQTIEFDIPAGFDGVDGTDGVDGANGWSPAFAIVSDGARRVLQVDDWVGGEGTKPATGDYVGATGLTPTIGDAVDIRGPAGTATIPDGDKGDITTSDGGDTWTINAAAVAGLGEFVGDTGTGGAKGVVPAPAAGDATKYLRGDGTWSGIGTVVMPPSGRLTLTSGTSAPAHVVGATTIYYTPYRGAFVPRYSGGNWFIDGFSEMALAGNSAHAANTNFDVFYFVSGGLGLIGTGPAWSSSALGVSSRGTGSGTSELTLLQGLKVNAHAMTVRNGSSTYSILAKEGLYLGTVRTTSAGTFEDSSGGFMTIAKRFVFNEYNRLSRIMVIVHNDVYWDYTSTTWRMAAGSANMQAQFVTSDLGDDIEFSGLVGARGMVAPAAGLALNWSAGEPSSPSLYGLPAGADGASAAYATLAPSFTGNVSPGFHSISFVERGAPDARFFGASPNDWRYGMRGRVLA